MSIYLIRFVFLLFVGTALMGCGGGGGGGGTTTTPAVDNQPALPISPVSRVSLGDDYVGFIIGKQPLTIDPSSANSLRFTQQLYELGADNSITPVLMYGQDNAEITLTGNLSYTDDEHIIPLDIIVLSPDYLLLTIYHRNFDQNEDNDYYNLLIDLHDGSVISAPLGLNNQGNSGRSNLTQAGRDVFPPDARWNLTDNLYVVSVDYDELGLMGSADYQPDSNSELVDHHNGVPCPVNEEGETYPNCTGTIGGVNTGSSDSSDTTNIEDLPTPTAVYRMDLAAGNQYELIKVSAEGDRPGLGQLIISDDGTIIYRNNDGGDNSYRVLIPDCEGVTGRLSTVLLSPYNTLIIAPDRDNISSVFEVTYAGMNKLKFSCNGNIEREAYTSYSTRVDSLKLPYNSMSIATYDYSYPYFLNTSCESASLFPSQPGFTSILSPMPIIPGLGSSDVRGIRKSQFFNGRLYCLGYDTALELAIAELDPSDNYPAYQFLNFDFQDWLPNFDTVHVLSNNNVIFTGTTRVASTVRTMMIDTAGVEIDLGASLAGFIVGQQVEVTPPGTTYTLPAAD